MMSTGCARTAWPRIASRRASTLKSQRTSFQILRQHATAIAGLGKWCSDRTAALPGVPGAVRRHWAGLPLRHKNTGRGSISSTLSGSSMRSPFGGGFGLWRPRSLDSSCSSTWSGWNLSTTTSRGLPPVLGATRCGDGPRYYGEDLASREADGHPTLVEKTHGHQGTEREWQLSGNAALQNNLSWVFVEKRSGGRTTFLRRSRSRPGCGMGLVIHIGPGPDCRVEFVDMFLKGFADHGSSR